MTTNAGAQEMSRSSIGFQKQDHSTDGMEVIKKMFTPEFRNRLDSIIQFSALSKDVIKTVVDKFLVEIQVQLDDKKVQLDVTDEAREWLAENGYDEKYGARPLRRSIERLLEDPLAEALLSNEVNEGNSVIVDREEDALTFKTIEDAETASSESESS